MENLTLNIDGNHSAQKDKFTVLLSLSNPKDRQLIQNFLPGPQYIDIRFVDDLIDRHAYDLCIVDEQTLPIYRNVLQKLKNQSTPVFLPMLLLSQNKDQVRSDSALLEFADDVIYIPASKKVMKSRIELLLQQRKYSLKLEEKNRQLEQKNKELAEEKRKYQLLADNSTDMISLHKPDGTYLYASPASKELTGYTPEELIGQNVFENIHPDDKERLQDEVKDFEDSKIERWEFRKQTKDGNFKWVEAALRPIGDEETGEIIEVQASTRDISERKEFEKKLQEEKEFIDKSIQSLPELFYLIDEEQNFIKWNNIEQELGYTDEEVQDMDPLDFYREEDREFITSKILEAFKEGSAETEIQMVSKSGDLKPYYITAKRFSRGDNNYIVGFCMNLSAIKEAQYELEQQRELLDAVVNQTKSLIYIKDQSGEYRLVNDSYLAFYNLKRENVIGKKDREVHGQKIADQTLGQDYKVLEDQQTIEVEEERTNGYESRLYHTIKYPLRGIPGLENCMCGICTDVSDRVKYEQELEDSLKEKETLLQEIHHRVKNNLAVVSGMMELQTFNTDNEEVKGLLDDSKNRIKTMALIHEKLYESSSLSRIDFGSYVEDLLGNIGKVSAIDKQIKIDLNYDSFNLNVNQAVPSALIINEVVANAFEHAFVDKKEGLIEVTLKQNGENITVNIKDNGRGLPDDSDYRSEKSIGITIIETLIKQLEAEQKIENNNGLSFTFTFAKQDIKGSSSSLV
ncbi:PAS domain S-box protein [Fodinibius sp. Rm-B-1B1-1]|uniref:PAS domain S-box protein n=1 Tax=Fodinibius alkaliphilus TaxID=3140241 RepID=UPI00315ADE24